MIESELKAIAITFEHPMGVRLAEYFNHARQKTAGSDVRVHIHGELSFSSFSFFLLNSDRFGLEDFFFTSSVLFHNTHFCVYLSCSDAMESFPSFIETPTIVVVVVTP